MKDLDTIITKTILSSLPATMIIFAFLLWFVKDSFGWREPVSIVLIFLAYLIFDLIWKQHG